MSETARAACDARVSALRLRAEKAPFRLPETARAEIALTGVRCQVIMTAGASAKPKDAGLFGPAHRKVLADDPGDAKVSGLASFQDRSLNAGCKEGERDTGADVGLGMTRLAGDVGQ